MSNFINIKAMKKKLILLVALMPLFALAQKFEMVPGTFVNADDTTKNYVVVELEGTQAELYQKAKTALTMIYNSPKDVMSYNEPDVIIANGYTEDAAIMKRMGMTFAHGMHYRMQFMFKDGRIRINAPQVDKADYYNPSSHKVTSSIYFTEGSGGMSGDTYIWDKKGKLKQDKIKKSVEDYFNALIATFISKMKDSSSDADW